MRDISFDEIAPFVRFANENNLSHATPFTRTYDHRLFYIVSGTGTVFFPDGQWKIQPGNVLFWLSGTAYRICPEGELRTITVNFDFTRAHDTQNQSIPPIAVSDFAPDRQLEILHFTDIPEWNTPALLESLPKLFPLLQMISEELWQPDRFSDCQISHLFFLVLNLLRRNLQTAVRNHLGSYREILAYIQSHFAENLTNQSLADRFGYHPNYISSLLTAHTGVPLHRYLLKIRIRQAISLLETTQIPIGDIATRVGFQNTSYFSQYFRKCTGYPPKAFRNG